MGEECQQSTLSILQPEQTFHNDELISIISQHRHFSYPCSWCKSMFCLSARSVFFFGGFHWIATRGRMCSVKEAPILVLAPHSSYLDSIIIVFLGMCSVVGKLETSKISLVGSEFIEVKFSFRKTRKMC